MAFKLKTYCMRTEILLCIANAINAEVTIIDQAEPTKPNLGNPNHPI